MAMETNKVVARRFIEEGINKNKTDMIDQYFTQDYVDHSLPPGIPQGLQGFKMFLGAFLQAFPDLRYTIEDEIAEGDKLVHYLTGRGTMKGEFQGVPPTGQTGEWKEVHIARFENGKITEHWGLVDRLGMLQSLGVMPQGGQAGR